ncbi:MAG: DUF4037 domain-containing protein [Planctomycetes bacterium]|nr:DUF4037 domain-containing protein [Planctomycetota bacterium]
MKGSDLSRQFFEQVILPLLEKAYPEVTAEMAAGVLGMGSDVSGLDDDLSRDHHWGPRCNLLLSDWLEARCGEIEAFLHQHAPRSFLGFEVYQNKLNRSGVTVETLGHFFHDLLGQDQAPSDAAGWFRLTEADLFHVTGGQVFHDATGELERRRRAFAYYPDPVWRKKMADWLVYLTAHGGYNMNRARQRGDGPSAAIYLGVTVKRTLEMGHLLNRAYAPYNKWLYRSFRRLPCLSSEIVPLLEHALAMPSWEEKILDFVRINVVINDELHRQGLTRLYYPRQTPPRIDEAWLHFLYDAAIDLYRSVPEPLVWGRFNDVEKWEEVVKKVLLDPNWKSGFSELKSEGQAGSIGRG